MTISADLRAEPGGDGADAVAIREAGEVQRICVFCGSRPGRSPRFASIAETVGSTLAHRGYGLVYGGGRVGLMGILADAALDAGGEVIGVIPGHLQSAEVAHPGLTELRVTRTMHERKAQMSALADGFLVLPGGFGTFEEAIEILTWNQLGLVDEPVVFVEVDGFWDGLFAFFEIAAEEGFLRPEHAALAQRSGDVDTAIDLALGRVPPLAPKWMGES